MRPSFPAQGAGRLEIVAGAGEPRALELPQRQVVGPLTVGRSGGWRVAGPGTLEIHAHVYFDGARLFVQSADPTRPALVGGRPLGGAWTPVDANSELSLGGARLRFVAAAAPAQASPPAQAGQAAAHAAHAAHAAPIQRGPQAPQAGPGRPAAAATGAPARPYDDETDATRLQPIEELLEAQRARQSAAAFAPGQPEGGAGPAKIPTQRPPPAGPAATPAEGSWEAAKRAFREASLPRKLTWILAPFALGLTAWTLLAEEPKSAQTVRPRASASASARPVESATSAPLPSSAPTSSAPTSSAAPAGKAPSAASGPAEKTREREAVDAVAAGAFEKAAAIYEELAKAHPENPAYAEAARILRARAKR